MGREKANSICWQWRCYRRSGKIYWRSPRATFNLKEIQEYILARKFSIFLKHIDFLSPTEISLLIRSPEIPSKSKSLDQKIERVDHLSESRTTAFLTFLDQGAYLHHFHPHPRDHCQRAFFESFCQFSVLAFGLSFFPAVFPQVG